MVQQQISIYQRDYVSQNTRGINIGIVKYGFDENDKSPEGTITGAVSSRIKNASYKLLFYQMETR